MPRLYIFAEGQTEQTYGDDVLKHHLANFGVYVHGPVLIAHAKRKGRVHRGGGRKYLPMRNDILRFLAQEKANDTALQAIAQAHASPEEIDDGAQTAPSKRIIEQFPDYEGAKRTAGPQIAASIGVDAIRDRCPHFDAWVAKLEKLGTDAPEES